MNTNLVVEALGTLLGRLGKYSKKVVYIPTVNAVRVMIVEYDECEREGVGWWPI